jgi:hypothetical protein
MLEKFFATNINIDKMPGKATISNFTFLLHHGFTAPMLLVVAIIVTSHKIAESPILCYVDDAPNGKYVLLFFIFCYI